MNRVETLVPLIVGSVAVACTMVIHGAALETILRVEVRRLGRLGTGFWTDLLIVVPAVTTLLTRALTGSVKN